VFFDNLSFCHVIELRDRLEIDYPTVSLVDLLLEKLQIVEINEKDIIDCIMLLCDHSVGEADNETINKNYLATLFAREWGWWRTGTMNLDKIMHFVDGCDQLTDEDKNDVHGKIDALREAIEAEPKSRKWRRRAKIGDKRKWYRDVEEVVR
jgi:hypothetical protein